MKHTSPYIKRAQRVMALVALLSFATPTVSWSQTTDAAKDKRYDALTQSAAKKYADKDYEGAIKEFRAAYAVKPVANILYNIGRIYEKMGKFDEAVKEYENFVNQPDIELAPRQDALARIKTLREVLALRKKEEPKEVEKPKEIEKPKEVVVKPPPTPKPEESNTLAYVFLGTGTAALLGGAVFSVLTMGAHEDFESASSLEDRRNAADTGQTYGYVADGLLIGGGIFALTGLIIMAASGSDEAPQENATSVRPNIGPDRFSVDLSFNF